MKKDQSFLKYNFFGTRSFFIYISYEDPLVVGVHKNYSFYTFKEV